jgi:hypothetical protein
MKKLVKKLYKIRRLAALSQAFINNIPDAIQILVNFTFAIDSTAAGAIQQKTSNITNIMCTFKKQDYNGNTTTTKSI